MSKPTPHRSNRSGSNRGGHRGGGNNRGQQNRNQNNRKDSGSRGPAPPAAAPPGFDSACLLAFLLSIGAYGIGVIGLLLTDFSAEWSSTLLFFARAMAIGGVIFAIVLARAMEHLSQSQRWKINGAIYPGISYMLAWFYTSYAPHGLEWGGYITGAAFLLGLVAMAVFSLGKS